MWDYTSINDIKRATQLKFVVEKRPEKDVKELYKHIVQYYKMNCLRPEM